MQGLRGQHGENIVCGGALGGMCFKQLSTEQLKRAAKRYPADPKLQKYARASVAISELGGVEEEPAPCAPLRPANANPIDSVGSMTGVRQKLLAFAKKSLWKALTHPVWKYVFLLVLGIFLVRPGVMNAITKWWGKFLRLMLRQLFLLVSMVLESIADEIIYQLDFAIRDALPPHIDIKDIPKQPLQTLSHLVSAAFGAGCVYLTAFIQQRRNAPPLGV